MKRRGDIQGGREIGCALAMMLPLLITGGFYLVARYIAYRGVTATVPDGQITWSMSDIAFSNPRLAQTVLAFMVMTFVSGVVILVRLSQPKPKTSKNEPS